jgi:hypothetical protein
MARTISVLSREDVKEIASSFMKNEFKFLVQEIDKLKIKVMDLERIVGAKK